MAARTTVGLLYRIGQRPDSGADMVVEKEQALHEIELQFEELFAKFNRFIADDDYAAAEKLNGTILSLEIQYNKVNAVPTWPWRSETARVVLSAIALPVFLMSDPNIFICTKDLFFRLFRQEG